MAEVPASKEAPVPIRTAWKRAIAENVKMAMVKGESFLRHALPDSEQEHRTFHPGPTDVAPASRIW